MDKYQSPPVVLLWPLDLTLLHRGTLDHDFLDLCLFKVVVRFIIFERNTWILQLL